MGRVLVVSLDASDWLSSVQQRWLGLFAGVVQRLVFGKDSVPAAPLKSAAPSSAEESGNSFKDACVGTGRLRQGLLIYCPAFPVFLAHCGLGLFSSQIDGVGVMVPME